MRFGVCCNTEQMETVRSAGFDYAELCFRDWALQSEEDFRRKKLKIDAMDGFHAEAMNVMIPESVHLTGRDTDFSSLRGFLEKGFRRASAAGTKVVAFGSGKARSLPDGFSDRAQAYGQLEEFLRFSGACAAPYGIHIAIEPLSFRESNIINLVSEAAYLAELVDRENVCCLADYYHIAGNRENCKSITDCAKRIGHCHIASPRGRTLPLPEDGWDYTPFFSALKESGYRRRISIEGAVPWEDHPLEALEKSLRYLKACTGQTGI